MENNEEKSVYERLKGAPYEFESPKEEGEYILKLVGREWIKLRSYALKCEFCDQEGKGMQLFAFHGFPKGTRHFGPRDCNYDFSSEVQLDTWWRCKVKRSRAGRLTWTNAEPLSTKEITDRLGTLQIPLV